MARRVVAAGIGAASLALAAFASAPSAQQVFRASTDIVLLNVSASEAGRAVLSLDRDDFQVIEDGRPQEITLFARERLPVSLSILMDTSSSMEPKIRLAQEAAIAFCHRLGAEDLAQFTTFNSDIQVRQRFTNDAGLLERAIRQTRADGNTSLYTAVYVSLDELTRMRSGPTDPVRRQAIVLLSDGEDTTSLLGYEDVLDRAKRSDVLVFAIGIRDRNLPAPGFNEYDYAMRSMAQTTGGRVFYVENPLELPAIYAQIADELANKYTIGYTSRNTSRDGAWRQVAVRINRPGVVARTRAGYFAPNTKGP